jgi:hypothetical protein
MVAPAMDVATVLLASANVMSDMEVWIVLNQHALIAKTEVIVVKKPLVFVKLDLKAQLAVIRRVIHLVQQMEASVEMESVCVLRVSLDCSAKLRSTFAPTTAATMEFVKSSAGLVIAWMDIREMIARFLHAIVDAMNQTVDASMEFVSVHPTSQEKIVVKRAAPTTVSAMDDVIRTLNSATAIRVGVELTAVTELVVVT